MLRNSHTLLGRPIVALDGEAGKLKDFLFDDQTWSIRHLIAETKTWRRSRRVVIPSIFLWPADRDCGSVPVQLTIEQVRNSLGTDSVQTVSGRYRLALQQCQFLPHCWMPDAVHSEPSIVPPALDEVRADEAESTNLRSAREVIGYRVQGIDGEVGTISDFVVDDATWVVRYISVRAGFWLFSRTTRLSADCIERLSWLRKDLTAAVTRSSVKWHQTRLYHRTYRPKEPELHYVSGAK